MAQTTMLRDPPSLTLGSPAAVSRSRAKALESGVRTFLELSAALELSPHEERAMLNLTPREMAMLRLSPSNALQLGGGKLERRVDYAIPILQRMIASMSS